MKRIIALALGNPWVAGGIALAIVGAVAGALLWHSGKVSELRREAHAAGVAEERGKWVLEREKAEAARAMERAQATQAVAELETKLVQAEAKAAAEERNDALDADIAEADRTGGNPTIPRGLLRSVR